MAQANSPFYTIKPTLQTPEQKQSKYVSTCAVNNILALEARRPLGAEQRGSSDITTARTQ